MSLATQSLRRRWRVLLMTGVGACVAVLVSQCRLVEDNVLGPDGLSISAQERSGNCISACARAYADSNRVESALHTENVRACAQNAACLAAESARHAAAVQRLIVGRRDCMDGCHHQGGGSGGR